MKPVFPYPTLFGDVDVEVMSVTVDGAQLPYAQLSTAERTVALHGTGRDDWEQATLRLKATVPDEEIAAGPWSEVVCLVALSEKATNARTTTRLTRDADGGWHGTIDLDRTHHFDRATLDLTVVGTVDDVAGRAIGSTGQDWLIDLRANTPVRQREIEIVTWDFRDEKTPDWLRPFKEVPWVVETVGEVPTVYLNAGAVEGLMEVLNSTGGTPAEKLLREMTAGQIAQDSWTAMFHTAVSDLEFDDDGSPLMPTGWRESVLRMMLPDVLPGRQLTDALYEINQRRNGGHGWPELQSRIQYAAGRRSRIPKKLTDAVRILKRAEGSVS